MASPAFLRRLYGIIDDHPGIEVTALHLLGLLSDN